MAESWLSLKQAVELLDFPENSCKNYINQHSQFVKFDKLHNRYRIHVSAIETLKTIRRLYGEGYKREAVDEYLRGSGLPITITVDDSEGVELVNINQEIQDIKKAMVELMQKSESDKREILEKSEADKQELKQMINHYESEKVKELRDTIIEVSASVESVKVNQEAEKNKGFFGRLFGR